MSDSSTYRLTGWASWGITVYAGTMMILSGVYLAFQVAVQSPHEGMAASLLAVSVLLTATAALSSAQVRITIDDEGIRRVDGAGRSLVLSWESVDRLERQRTSQWNERHFVRSEQGTIVFDRTWDRWEELKSEIQRRAYRAQRLW